MIRNIEIDELEVGMYVEGVDRPWLELPFFKRNIQTAQQIENLRKWQVRKLSINTDKGKDLTPKSPSQRPGARVTAEVLPVEPPDHPQEGPGEKRFFDREGLKVCQALHHRAVQCVKQMLLDVEAGRSMDLDGAREVVDGLVENMGRHPKIMVSLSKLKSFDDYTFTHSVNVSIFSMTLGEALNYTQGDLRKLGLGALLHDIGKTRVPGPILKKPGRLTPDEFKVIQKHPLDGVEILKYSPDVDADVFSVALQHHERISGRGYPKGLKGGHISEFGLIASIADIYDAMTSDRVYSKGKVPHKALAEMYTLAKTDLHPELVDKFITRIGVYPIGSVVVLTTGDVGVVVRFRSDHLLYPVVLILLDKRGQPVHPSDEVDLLHDKKKRRIQAVTHPEKFGLVLEEMI